MRETRESEQSLGGSDNKLQQFPLLMWELDMVEDLDEFYAKCFARMFKHLDKFREESADYEKFYLGEHHYELIEIFQWLLV